MENFTAFEGLSNSFNATGETDTISPTSLPPSKYGADANGIKSDLTAARLISFSDAPDNKASTPFCRTCSWSSLTGVYLFKASAVDLVICGSS